VRLLHWTLVLGCAVATLAIWRFSDLHQPAGYVALAAVLLRLLWAGFGSRHARFTSFLRSPRTTLAYAADVLRGRERRFVGHNPLGGWMIVALMLTVGGLALTGWLYTSDWLWGDETVENVHVAFAWALLALVILHVGGVVFTSLRHRENLVAAMFSGRKRGPAADDIG
jgi:cytochrome b